MRLAPALFAAVASLAAPAALAQSCGIFTDVLATSPFCQSITWMRNRAITLGCATGQYCPNGFVTRGEMAAFINRAASAADPVTVRVEQTSGPFSLAAPQVICKTPVQTVAFSRKYRITGMFSATGSGNDDILVTPMISVNGGAFGNLNQTNEQMSLSSSEWRSVPFLSVPQPGIVLVPGTNYEFGIYLQRAIGSTVDIAASRCYYFLELLDRPDLG